MSSARPPSPGNEETLDPEVSPAGGLTPGQGGDLANSSERGADLDAALRRYLSLPPIRISIPRPPAVPSLPVEEAPLPRHDEQDFAKYREKLLATEPLLLAGRWDEIARQLAAEEHLPPQLALLYAVARKESVAEGGPGSEAIAIQAAAALLGVPAEHPVALVVAKRILRKNPVAWRERKASPRTSVLLILGIAALGALAGYLASPGMPFGRW